MDTDIETAASDGGSFMWSSPWFLSLNPEVRKTVLIHALWHPAMAKGTRIAVADNFEKAVQIIELGQQNPQRKNGPPTDALLANSGD